MLPLVERLVVSVLGCSHEGCFHEGQILIGLFEVLRPAAWLPVPGLVLRVWNGGWRVWNGGGVRGAVGIRACPYTGRVWCILSIPHRPPPSRTGIIIPGVVLLCFFALLCFASLRLFGTKTCVVDHKAAMGACSGGVGGSVKPIAVDLVMELTRRPGRQVHSSIRSADDALLCPSPPPKTSSGFSR